jgi:hypothetical protein
VSSYRHATAVDVVRRLTGSPYLTTRDLAVGGRMGDAVIDIAGAVDEAIADGFVVPVPSAAHTDLLTLAYGIAYCQTCIDGCDHETGGATSCGHRACWGPDATNDCTGITVARYVDDHCVGMYESV